MDTERVIKRVERKLVVAGIQLGDAASLWHILKILADTRREGKPARWILVPVPPKMFRNVYEQVRFSRRDLRIYAATRLLKETC